MMLETESTVVQAHPFDEPSWCSPGPASGSSDDDGVSLQFVAGFACGGIAVLLVRAMFG